MNDSILDFRDPRGLANDIQFCEALNHLERARQKIFFDTSGVVDMLLGWDAMLDVNVRYIKWPFFQRPSLLICALAYKKWLGPIHLLPPHTEELTSKMLGDKRRFPNEPLENTEVLTNEFWGSINLHVKESGLDKNTYIAALQKDATSIFKGVFLGSHGGFWKARYKHLVSDAQILHLATSVDYDYGDITSHRLFRPLLRFLNAQRNKQANNYLDAIALCLLDDRLRQFKASNTSTALPIFFSDQEAILKAVRHFSQERDKEGRYPFTYLSPTGRPFLIVRNCNFFIISGIYQGIRESALPDLLDKYSNYLTSLRRISNENAGNEEEDHDTGAALSLQSYVQPSSEKNVLLSFFQQWWIRQGHQDLNTILSDQLGRPRDVTNEEVNLFIEAEQARQRQQMKGFGDRIGIIRGIWHDFADLPTFVEKNYRYTGVDLNVYKEIGPRLYYPEVVCKEVQEHTNRIFQALRERESHDWVETITEVVDDLASSLFTGRDKSFDAEKLDRLASGLAVLWIFEKFARIGQICDTVYERYHDFDPSDEGERYPSPAIAFMHTAAILAGRLPRQDHALEIIDYVMRRYGTNNYNIWLGLSYIHISIWRFSGGGFSCPEWHFYRTEELDFEPPYKNHLEEGLRLSRQTYEWLRQDEKQNKNLTLEKKRARQTKLFYALNNYLFTLAICGGAGEFQHSLYLAEVFQDGASIRDVWHEGRYADTLACYYLRMALLSRTPGEFDRNIQGAKAQNEASIAGSNLPNDAYRQISMRINEIAEKGFVVIQQKMLQYNQKLAVGTAV